VTFVTQSEPIQWKAFDRLRDEKGWTDAEAARQIGISHGHLTNARAGRHGVGRKFIDGCVTIWGPERVYAELLGIAA
jgi:hypothetical protein